MAGEQEQEFERLIAGLEDEIKTLKDNEAKQMVCLRNIMETGHITPRKINPLGDGSLGSKPAVNLGHFKGRLCIIIGEWITPIFIMEMLCYLSVVYVEYCILNAVYSIISKPLMKDFHVLGDDLLGMNGNNYFF